MKLQTTLSLKKEPLNTIDYSATILMLGSCFSENIGKKLTYFKFQTKVNPFGILFHPQAIETFITHSINNKKYTEEDLFFYQERWHSFDAHSCFSNPNKSVLLENLNAAIQNTHKDLREASHLVLTLGTAWVYRHVADDQIVANCHKVEQKKFLKELLSPIEIEQSLEAIIALIKSINPTITILLTISPVRHLKDGFIENTQSKSHLIAAVHNVTAPNNKVYYFPSYELMMDELRDYRFYSEDLVHPNKTAIDYIWEKFCTTWMTSDTENTMKIIDGIQRDIAHKPFFEQSEQHQQFLKKLSAKKERILKEFPNIQF